MTKKQTKEVLKILDEIYGIEKDGFPHEEPWQLLVAIMLSAQSTDKQVEAALPGLFGRFQSAKNVADADEAEIEELIKTIGLHHSKAKNMKKCCRQLVEDYDGEVPQTMKELTGLAGVGRKTANLFLADAHGIPGVTVDTHVNRISNRLGWSDSSDPVKTEERLKKVLPKDHWIRINIQLIRHGRAICKARNPLCEKCPLQDYCLYLKKAGKRMEKDGLEELS